MKQIAKLGCRALIAVLCLAMLASVITVPAFAAESPDLSALAGGDLGFLMGMLQQYNNVKNDPDAAEQMKEYVEEQYNSDASFKESADSMLGGDNTEGEENKTLDNLNSVIDNVFTEEFTIKWMVGEDVIAEEIYKYGETPSYKGELPVKADDEHFSYTFAGWSPVIMAVKGAATYVAVFSATELDPVEDGYTVTFVTGNGTTVRSFELDATATDAGIITDKATDANFSYTFIGWDKVVDAEGNQTWTAKYDKKAVEKSWSDILTSGKVVEEYFGSIDNVMDAVQNGASVEDLKESIQHQQREEQNKAEDPNYVPPVYTVSWVLDGKKVAEQEYSYKQLIKQPAIDSVSAGKYVSWSFDHVLMPEADIEIKGETVDIVEEIIADVNGMPFNYGEYEMVYKNGVATLYVNVNAKNYNEIIRDVLGDVRGGGAQSAYKEAVLAFLQSAAMHMYSSKTNTIDVNGHEVFGIEGYSASQLIDLMADVQAGNYGKLISVDGIKQAVLSERVGLSTLENLGDDGVLTTYDITLGADGKQDYSFDLQIALKGNLELIRKGAKAVSATIDYMAKQDGDLYVEITVPAVFTTAMKEALNQAGISDQTKQTIVKGMSESATVGELLSLFDLLTYEQFNDVLNFLLDQVQIDRVDEQSIIDKAAEIRPAIDLMQKYGDILIDKVPESVSGKEASVTIKSIYNLIQAVSYEDLAALTQLKDADALVGSARMDAAVARVAAKLNVSTDRAQAIVERMVEVFADYQNRIPDSAKAQTAYSYVDKLIDALYNRIPAKFQDAKLTDTYKGNGEFSWAFDTTYNPGAWLKNLLADVSFTAYGRTIVFADYIPSRAFTSEVEIAVNVFGLYSVTYMDGDKVLFEGFLPSGTLLAPYVTGLEKDGYDLIWVDAEGNELTAMPAADTVVYAKYVAHEYTITFVDEDGTTVLDSGVFAHGQTPIYNGKLPTKDSTVANVYAFKGWMDAEGNLYEGELPAAVADATYTAVYEEDDRTYEIVFNVLGNLISKEFAYGEIPSLDASYTNKANLTFKGWEGYGFELPAVTGEATYVADYWATLTFIVEGVKTTEEYKYGATPVVPAPHKAADYQHTYKFTGWKSAGAVYTKIPAVTGHATYEAKFDVAADQNYGEGVTVERVPTSTGVTYKVYFGDYRVIDNRVTASATITPILELALSENATLEAHITPNASIPGAHAISITLDNAALRNIYDNKTQDEVTFEVSSLVGTEAEWPANAPAFGKFDAVYSFDLLGSAFNAGNATVKIPFEKNIDKWHSYVYYVSNAGAQSLTANADEKQIEFTTSHFSYYAVDYEQFLYHITFQDVNGNVIKVVEINTDNGDTFTQANVPGFVSTLPAAIASGHYKHEWRAVDANGNVASRGTDPVATFNNSDPKVDRTFREAFKNVGHNWGDCEYYDEAQHSYTCIDCGFVKYEDHDWDSITGDCDCGDHKDVTTDTTTEDTTPEGTTPEDTTPEGTTPEDTTPEGTTPEDTTPEGTTPEDTTPEGTTPEDTTPEGTTPEDTTPEGTTPEDTTPEGTTPEDTTPEGTTPEDSTPEDSTPEDSTPEDSTPSGSGEQTSEEATTDPGTEDPDKKNGLWVFIIILLLIVAILIIAYILYGHNIFPKGPAGDEPVAEPVPEEPVAEAPVEPVVEPVAAPVVEEIHIVEHVAAAEVDALMTDAQAVSSVVIIAATASGKMGAVNVGTLNHHYEAGEKVDIASLKAKKLISSDCKRVKILADGDLDKALTVEADSFSLQAIKMITLTGGHAVKLQANAPKAEEKAPEAVEEAPKAEDTAPEAEA